MAKKKIIILDETVEIPMMPNLPKANSCFEQLSTGKVIHNGNILGKEEIDGIIELAKGLSYNKLLVDLIIDIENKAAKKIYYESDSLQDLAYGKGMLNALDLLRKKIINVSKIKT